MFTPENLPNLLKELEKFKETLAGQNIPSLWQHLDESQKLVQEVQSSLTNPQQKQALAEMLGESTRARNELQNLMPGLLADLNKQHEASVKKIRELAADIERAERAFEDKLKEEADLAAQFQMPPVDAPEAPFDPNLGAGLATEFLQAMGLLDIAPTKKVFDDAGSVARMWDDHAHEGTQAAPAAKEKPPEPVPAPAPSSKRATPLRRPPQEKSPPQSHPSHEESIGNWPQDE